jgi:hypothetical protein
MSAVVEDGDCYFTEEVANETKGKAMLASALHAFSPDTKPHAWTPNRAHKCSGPRISAKGQSEAQSCVSTPLGQPVKCLVTCQRMTLKREKSAIFTPSIAGIYF